MSAANSYVILRTRRSPFWGRSRGPGYQHSRLPLSAYSLIRQKEKHGGSSPKGSFGQFDNTLIFTDSVGSIRVVELGQGGGRPVPTRARASKSERGSTSRTKFVTGQVPCPPKSIIWTLAENPAAPTPKMTRVSSNFSTLSDPPEAE
jgi:hypothetical protein